MFFQMHMILMPMADNSQRIMFKLMPVIFLFECYFTIWADFVLDCTNLLTIIQQYAVSSKQAGSSVNGVSAKNAKKDVREGNSKKRSRSQRLLKKN